MTHKVRIRKERAVTRKCKHECVIGRVYNLRLSGKNTYGEAICSASDCLSSVLIPSSQDIECGFYCHCTEMTLNDIE